MRSCRRPCRFRCHDCRHYPRRPASLDPYRCHHTNVGASVVYIGQFLARLSEQMALPTLRCNTGLSPDGAALPSNVQYMPCLLEAALPAIAAELQQFGSAGSSGACYVSPAATFTQ